MSELKVDKRRMKMGEINNDKVCRLCKHCKTEYYICDIDNQHKDSEDTCEHFKSINVRAIRTLSKAVDKVQDINNNLEKFSCNIWALSIIRIAIVVGVVVWIFIF